MPERADQRQFLAGEEVHEGAAAGAHVVDRVLDAELLDRSGRVPAADDGEAIRLGDGGQEFPRPDGKWLELEDPGGTVVEDRLGVADLVDVPGDRVEADVVNRKLRWQGARRHGLPLSVVVQD